MPTKVEIVETINQGTDQVRRTFGSLTPEQLQTRVHDGDHGWTAKEVLAHLAARRPVNERLLGMAEGDSTAPLGGSAIDDWNQALVDERLNNSMDALLAEFVDIQDALVAQVQALPDDQLARRITVAQREMQLGELLGMAGGMHASHHAQEVERALAQSTS